MIVIVCTDDSQLEEIARHSIRHHPLVFERKFKVFHNELPRLREDENLFIIAHGAFQGDEGEPVIGDQRAAFYLDGRDCYHKSIPYSLITIPGRSMWMPANQPITQKICRALLKRCSISFIAMVRIFRCWGLTASVRD